jgi:hypothetical protein
MPLHVRGYRRQIIQQGPMKMKDAKNSQDVYCYLFTDLFLITKGGKRSGSSNSSAVNINNDSQSNRSPSSAVNKILKAPIRIDRLDVREYDRRGGNITEPHTVRAVDRVNDAFSSLCLLFFTAGVVRRIDLLGIQSY